MSVHRICPQCGLEQQPGTQICPRCGAGQPAIPPPGQLLVPPPGQVPYYPGSGYSSVPQPRKSSASPIGILIGCVVLAVVAIALFAVALPNFIRVEPPRREGEVKQNVHAIQLALERYATDHDGNYPVLLMGGDWTDSYVVWQSWVELQELDLAQIGSDKPEEEQVGIAERRDGWLAAPPGMGDALVMEAYMPSYPENPFMKSHRNSLSQSGQIYHFPNPAAGSPYSRIVGGREQSKMSEVFGPVWLGGPQEVCGDWYVHHIFNNPPYDFMGDITKEPANGWRSPSGNEWLQGNFSYYPKCWIHDSWPVVDGKLSTSGAAERLVEGYELAGYGDLRNPGYDVYNRNGNYKGRYRTEPCATDCTGKGGLFADDIPCICAGNGNAGAPLGIVANDGGSDTIPDGVIITLAGPVDKKILHGDTKSK